MSVSSLYSYILSNLDDLSNAQLTELLDLIEFNFLLNHLEYKFPEVLRETLSLTLSTEYKLRSYKVIT